MLSAALAGLRQNAKCDAAPASPSPVASLAYLTTLLRSREADLREGTLFRQGKGYLCTPSAGHENMAAIALACEPEDQIFCHYRDRALLLARGASLYSLALNFFAKRDSSSGGRQMAGHYSAPERNVISCASPIASQCIPASGMAWANQLAGKGAITVCCLGEAGLREGEFYEAYALAIQESLPLVFVVEDNGYGISTPTERMNPLKIGVFGRQAFQDVDGRDAEQVWQAMRAAAAKARRGDGPSILQLSFDRLLSHTSSDDQRAYRPAHELQLFAGRDPVERLKQHMLAEGLLNAEDLAGLAARVADEVRATYLRAEQAAEPDPADLKRDLFAPPVTGPRSLPRLTSATSITYAGALNQTLEQVLQANPRALMFGQDIEDPKGGVFGLTRGLSTRFPGRVVNAPLAEATICGAAAGLALAGYLPIFELQFVDFVATGFNQIANQLATMRWRTAGQLACPMILLAPCGGYLQGAGPWHTQTNESLFAHVPGLQVHMPATAMDVARIVTSCAGGADPAIVLLPKHLFFKEFPLEPTLVPYTHQARIVRQGEDLTIVTWGNCTDLALVAATELAERSGVAAEVIDLCSLVPCDLPLVAASIAKTGRVVVVHEDNRTCSFGQALIATIVTTESIWNTLAAAPRHVCRDDVLVPFNPTLARHALPSVADVIAASLAVVAG